MHELSIASAILDTVRAEAAARNAHIVAVGVRIGDLSGVEPEALRFGFEALVKGSDLDPLSLEIERRARRHRCSNCEAEFNVTTYDFSCPKCGELLTICIGGDELEIAYLTLEEPES